jgi:hypothetical protein
VTERTERVAPTRPRTRRRPVLAVAAVLATVAGAPRPAAAETPVERARVVAPAGVSIDGGGSTTEFTLQLPAGASCPGDSANDGYRVNSYMVPITLDPGSVTYDGLGPTPLTLGDAGTFVQPLYDIATNSFASAQTADAAAPGEPGPIVNLPAFSFAVFAPGDVPPGRYHLGIACTLLNQIVALWDAELIVTTARDDAPAQIHWTVPDVDPPGGSSDPTVAIGVIAALAAVALTIHRTRRRASPVPLTRSSSEER